VAASTTRAATVAPRYLSRSSRANRTSRSALRMSLSSLFLWISRAARLWSTPARASTRRSPGGSACCGGRPSRARRAPSPAPRPRG
jgi:hypothetical protein